MNMKNPTSHAAALLLSLALALVILGASTQSSPAAVLAGWIPDQNAGADLGPADGPPVGPALLGRAGEALQPALDPSGGPGDGGDQSALRCPNLPDSPDTGASEDSPVAALTQAVARLWTAVQSL